MENHTIFLAFGSNLGNKKENIETAYKIIEKQIGKIISQSAFYVTEPKDFNSDNFFINSVCEIASELSLLKVFSITQQIEVEIGRIQKSNNGHYFDRLIDIDLLMYDNVVVNTYEITVPHPRFHLRSFVLIPFAEIASNVIHPILYKTISQLKNDLQID
jgi:2-amino-4-hydroxy-6-hydroxymethyldihydropteridine diphosphokinase